MKKLDMAFDVFSLVLLPAEENISFTISCSAMVHVVSPGGEVHSGPSSSSSRSVFLPL
jgi:hypothetical protein